MREYVISKAKEIKEINEISMQDEIVIFGSSYMAKFPFYELVNKCHFENAIYNRSIEGLTISEAKEIFNDCVLGLNPSKLFISLGEEDISNPKAIDDYRDLLNKAKKSLPDTCIYLIALEGNGEYQKNFNKKILNLCDNKKVKYIELSFEKTSLMLKMKKHFKQLSRFFRSKPIDFSDAFELACI